MYLTSAASQERDADLHGYDYKTFLALASANRKLRDICIFVGVYHRVELVLTTELKPSLQMGHSFCHQPPETITSMVVDVGVPELWFCYYGLLTWFPWVKELVSRDGEMALSSGVLSHALENIGPLPRA